VTADDDMKVTQRRQDPFGNARGSATIWPDRHGFVNGLQDTSGLTQLGARGYDSSTGRFTQADPVVDTGDPQQMNGYSYSSGSPVSSSDPSGMMQRYSVPGAVMHPSCGNGASSPPPAPSPAPTSSPTQGQGGGGGSQSQQPERSSCSWWNVVCRLPPDLGRHHDAADLHVRDQLGTPGSGFAVVAASHRYSGSIRTYNLAVDEVRTFYVSAGPVAVLVHNCGPSDADPAPGIVFRALAKGEDPALGLEARAPDAVNVSPLSHVAGKRLSPWISTSKLPSVAFGKYNQGNGVVAIDLSRVDGRVEDVSGGFPGKGRIDLYAKKDQEVLIFGHVPADAIVGFWE
jgi:RHS repeat-associated protein